MFTRSAHRMLRALSAWLQRWTDRAAGVAAQLEVHPANELDSKVQPAPMASPPGRPPEDWLARTQLQPPAHWLEDIRRASAGQPVEIRVQAQPAPRPDASDQLPSDIAQPVIRQGSEPASIMTGQLATLRQAELQTPPAPATGVLPIPPGVAGPVLHLGGASVIPAPGPVSKDVFPQPEFTPVIRFGPVAGESRQPQADQPPANWSPGQEQAVPSQAVLASTAGRPEPAVRGAAGVPSPSVPASDTNIAPGKQSFPPAVAPATQRFQPIFPIPTRPMPKLPELPTLPKKLEEAASAVPATASLTKQRLDLPASSASQPPAAAQPGLAAEPVTERTAFPQTSAPPRWPDLLPLQAPVARTRRPSISGAFHASEILPASSPEALHPLSSHWPELPFSWMENEDWDVTMGDTHQQLERRQRLDREQRGILWNT